MRYAFFKIMIAGVVVGVSQYAFGVPYSVNNATSFTDFESFSAGDTINQYTNEADRGKTWSADDEWVGSPKNFDEEIIDDPGTYGNGTQGWRVSAYVGGGFAGEPWSPSVIPAGEQGSHLWNDRGSSNTSPLDPPNPNGSPKVNMFSASFDFWSKTGSLQEPYPGMFLSVSPGPRQSAWRQSYIGIDAESDNSSGGIDVGFYETVAGGSFAYHSVATGLDPGISHNIKMNILFRDGINSDGTGNDEVELYVNGTRRLASQDLSTWETYYRNISSNPSEIAVDSLLFNLNDDGETTEGDGLVFDNVKIASTPEPHSLVLGFIAAVVGCVVARYSKRKQQNMNT